MKNYIQEGKHVTITGPSGGLSSGDGVLIGSLFGIATTDIAEGDEGVICTQGIFELPKTSALAIDYGDNVYWDPTQGEVNKTASGQSRVGVAVEDAANPSSTVKVLLMQPVEPFTPEVLAKLTGSPTGTADGSIVDVAATAGSCAGGSSPTATQVDTAIATAVASIVTGVNEQNKELMTKINALIDKLVNQGILSLT